MELIILGTGNAAATKCYHTCFVLKGKKGCFLTDGGGGNGILKRLEQAGIRWQDIRHIFVTHKHMDHILGILWMMRMYCQEMSCGNYEEDVNIYAHSEVIGILENMARMLLGDKQAGYIGKKLHLVTVEDGQEREIIGQRVTFFDIRSTKAKQFGFLMELETGGRLTCCGDEPYQAHLCSYVRGSKWLLHEAFCLEEQADFLKPHEKHHSTVKEACLLAEELQAENLILYHTEDQNLTKRKERYLAEGQQYYHGNLFVPEDLESFGL